MTQTAAAHSNGMSEALDNTVSLTDLLIQVSVVLRDGQRVPHAGQALLRAALRADSKDAAE